MSRSNVKYELTGDDDDTNDYFLQHVQEYQNVSKKAIFWRKMMQIATLVSLYFVFSIGLTFYQKWLYGTYVSTKETISLNSFIAFGIIKILF